MISSPYLVRHLLGADFRLLHTAARKPPHTFRILVVGDSYAYGFGVAEHESMPAQLQQALNRSLRTPFIEVVNAARPGMNLMDEWAFVQQAEGWIEHDLLLLCLSSDDASPWSHWELEHRGTGGWQKRWRTQWHPDGSSLSHVATALGTLAERERSAGRTLALAFYEPVPGTAEMPLAVLPPLCKTVGIPFLDLVTPFRRFQPENLVVSTADRHPSPLAHRIAAAELGVFLGPLLPRKAGPSAAEALRERLEHLAGLERAEQEPSGLIWRHLASLPELVGEVAEAAGLLRSALNLLYHALLLARTMEWMRTRIGRLAERLFGLERLALMSRLGVEGTEAGAPASALWDELAAGTARTRDWLAELCQLAGAAAESPGSGEKGTFSLIEALRREAVEQRSEIWRHSILPVCRELDLLCAAAERVVRTHREVERLPQEAGELVRSISGELKGFESWLVEPLSMREDTSRTELIVQVQIPPDPRIRHVDLMCHFTSVAPYGCAVRMIQYVRSDGTAQACRFVPPEGSVGRATFEIKIAYGPAAPPETRTDGELFREISLVRDGRSQPYRPGDLFLCPLARPS